MFNDQILLMALDWGRWLADHALGIGASAFVLAFLYFFSALFLGWPLPFENRERRGEGEPGP